jgi:hypothetical protein
MKSKQQSVTLWRVDTKDGHSYCIPGDLQITRKRTALIWVRDDSGREYLMFGALARCIKNIEAIDEQQ